MKAHEREDVAFFAEMIRTPSHKNESNKDASIRRQQARHALLTIAMNLCYQDKTKIPQIRKAFADAGVSVFDSARIFRTVKAGPDWGGSDV